MRDFINIVESKRGTQIVQTATYKAPQSALDYPGVRFEKYEIKVDGNRAGEIEVQIGDKSHPVVTVRNVILYQPNMTGKGIGKAVYRMLRDHYDGSVVRSSYSTNIVNGRESVGLSDQAIAMWDSLVRDGEAEKVGGERFYYRLI